MVAASFLFFLLAFTVIGIASVKGKEADTPEDYLVAEQCTFAGDGDAFKDCDGVCFPDEAPYNGWGDDSWCGGGGGSRA